MTGPTWFLIGIAAGVAGNCLYLIARALDTTFRDRVHNLATRIDDLLDAEPEPDDHIEDDVWDRDLRQLLHDSID